MYFKKPLLSSDRQDIFHLAPVPVYMKVFDDDELHDRVYSLGKSVLSDKQKQMGVRILYVDIENFECRWKNKLDDYDAKRNELGQFIKLPKFKI